MVMGGGAYPVGPCTCAKPTPLTPRRAATGHAERLAKELEASAS